jgi:hypothetical protein
VFPTAPSSAPSPSAPAPVCSHAFVSGCSWTRRLSVFSGFSGERKIIGRLDGELSSSFVAPETVVLPAIRATASAPAAAALARMRLLRRPIELQFIGTVRIERLFGHGRMQWHAFFPYGRFARPLFLHFLIVLRNCGRMHFSAWRLGGESLCLLGTMHLFALLDQERNMSGDAGIGIDQDGDAESVLKPAQVGSFLIEQIKRNVAPGAHRNVVRGTLEQHLLDCAQYL